MDLLKKVATELIAKETLEQAEFYAIIGQSIPTGASGSVPAQAGV
jgi:hypothetical protein